MSEESRTELLWWVNNLLQLNYTHIEECGTGAAYCQIIDSISGNVPISKVKFHVKMEYEAIQNYKILQSAFISQGIEKTIPVTQLTKCRYNDNFQFLQWIKKYWDTHYSGKPYRAAEIRNRREAAAKAEKSRPVSRLNAAKNFYNNKLKQATMEGKQSRPGSGSTRKILASSTDALDLGENTSGEGDVAEGAGGGVGNNHSSNTINGSDSSKSPLLTASNSSNGAIANNSSAYRGVDLLSRELKETKMRYDEMSEKMNSIEVEMEGVRSERNFYFNKLTDIEALLKEKKFANNSSMLIAQINQILYMTEEGFELPFAQANSYPVMTGDQHHSATVSQPHSNNSRVSSTSSRKPSMAQVPEAVAQMHLMQMADIISTES